MTNYIQSSTELSILEGKIDEVKKLAAETIEKVEADEPNTLIYEWFFSDEESKCYIIERYKDSEAVMAHLANVGDILGPLFQMAQLTELKVFGDPSAEVRKALEPLGPKIVAYWNGFTR